MKLVEIIGFLLIITNFLNGTEITYVSIPPIGNSVSVFASGFADSKIAFPDKFKNKWVVLFIFSSVFISVCFSEIELFVKTQKN